MLIASLVKGYPWNLMEACNRILFEVALNLTECRHFWKSHSKLWGADGCLKRV